MGEAQIDAMVPRDPCLAHPERTRSLRWQGGMRMWANDAQGTVCMCSVAEQRLDQAGGRFNVGGNRCISTIERSHVTRRSKGDGAGGRLRIAIYHGRMETRGTVSWAV